MSAFNTITECEFGEKNRGFMSELDLWTPFTMMKSWFSKWSKQLTEIQVEEIRRYVMIHGDLRGN